jgi:hypothetical protein
MKYAYSHAPIAAPAARQARLYHKEMGFTRTEFERTLAAAVKESETSKSTQQGLTTIHFEDGTRKVKIQYSTLPNRTIGSLSLPRMQVDFVLTGFSESEAGAFFEKFNRAFLRIGGG